MAAKQRKRDQITPALFQAFRDYCKREQVAWGLTDWELEIELAELPDSYATTQVDPDGRLAVIRLRRSWGDIAGHPTRQALRRVAFHEMCHVLLGDKANEEATVRRLEHRILGAS